MERTKKSSVGRGLIGLLVLMALAVGAVGISGFFLKNDNVFEALDSKIADSPNEGTPQEYEHLKNIVSPGSCGYQVSVPEGKMQESEGGTFVAANEYLTFYIDHWSYEAENNQERRILDYLGEKVESVVDVQKDAGYLNGYRSFFTYKGILVKENGVPERYHVMTYAFLVDEGYLCISAVQRGDMEVNKTLALLEQICFTLKEAVEVQSEEVVEESGEGYAAETGDEPWILKQDLEYAGEFDSEAYREELGKAQNAEDFLNKINDSEKYREGYVEPEEEDFSRTWVVEALTSFECMRLTAMCTITDATILDMYVTGPDGESRYYVKEEPFLGQYVFLIDDAPAGRYVLNVKSTDDTGYIMLTVEEQSSYEEFVKYQNGESSNYIGPTPEEEE